MKKVIVTTILTILGLLAAPAVFADVNNCRPIYGGGKSCVQSKNFTVDKRIQDPESKNFVDNLGINDAAYGPAQTVNFAITVKNISKNALSNIKVTDTFPEFVDFAEGTGEYAEDTRTLTFTIAKLNPNESKTYSIKANVVAADNMPEDTTCLANVTQASIGNDVSADNTQFCLSTGETASPTQKDNKSTTKGSTQIPPTTKGGQPVYQAPNGKKSPATGPGMLSLIVLLPSALTGLLIKRKFK